MTDGKLGVCIDFEGPPEMAAKAVALEGAIKQSCDSLGQTALATCTTTTPESSTVVRYYRALDAERYLRDCVKKGGIWDANKSPEAELARAQQELEKVQK